jgi:hypothetical protein
LDFLFLESCIYLLGTFDKLDRVLGEREMLLRDLSRKIKLNDRIYDLESYLQKIRNFQEEMVKKPFYLKHQKYL